MDFNSVCGPAVQCVRTRPRSAACGCAAAAGALLLGLSFSSLEYTEVGLNLSHITNNVSPQGYTAGLYCLGPGNSFIKFPGTVQTIQFSLDQGSAGPPMRSRTSDGLEVQLEVSFQYQLNFSTVYDLYRKFGTQYKPVFVNMATDIITAKATAYNATAFFMDRPAISLAMEDELKEAFETEAFSSVPFFQLRSVSLPSEFEQAIQDTEVKVQDIQTANAEFQTRGVEMDTKILQAQQTAAQLNINADATSQQTILDAQAYVGQFGLSQSLQADSFKPLFEKLGGNESLLLEYMRMRALREHPDHLSIVRVTDP